jgi:hypothetical protein
MAIKNVKVTINKDALLGELGQGKNSRVTNSLVEESVEESVEKSRKEMLMDFQEHPITKEIDAGPNSSNSSGTLNGYGNLFSFIGFQKGSSPTSVIKTMLSKPIKLKVKRSRRGKFVVETDFPNKEEIENSAQIPWATGLSWVKGIEKGISGLGEFLYKSKASSASRSGKGIQTKANLNRKFITTSYFSKIYKDFINRIK